MYQVVSARFSSDAIGFIDAETSKILNNLNEYR
jgi:hypothetical protein